MNREIRFTARKVGVLCVALTLLVSGSSDGRDQQAPQAKQPPSSYQLINDALAAGKINEETAYKYRVFAAFGHPGLPEQYRGVDSLVTEVPKSVLKARAMLSTFSAQTQAELAPFFLPPAMKGSWVDIAAAGPGSSGELLEEIPDDAPLDDSEAAPPSHRAPQWFTVPAAGGRVKVWAYHPGDSAKAVGIAREMTATIWPTLVPLLGTPLSDRNFPLNSGGPEIDIYLVRPSFTPANEARNIALAGRAGAWRGIAMFADPYKCKEVAFFLLINSVHALGSATTKGLLQDVAHEFTHAITGAKPLRGECENYDWMGEATAVWAEHKTYPKAQSEHGWAFNFLDDVSLPLDTYTPGDFNNHAYDSYLFPFYLGLTGKEAVIPDIWRNFAALNERPAINAALRSAGLKFEEVFPKFAVQNLNQASAEEYRLRDQVHPSAKIADTYDVSIAPGAAEYEKLIPLGIKYLAAKNVQFNFDQTVKTITFENTLVPVPYGSVWVLERINSDWKDPVDLTKQSTKTWCRDHPLEDADQLIFVFTNTEWRNTRLVLDPAPQFQPVIRAYPYGCGRGWTGTSDLTNTITSTDPNLIIVETVHTTMRFAVDSALIAPGKPREYWKAVGGSINWNVTVTGDCTGSAQGNVPIVDRRDDHIAVLRVWSQDGKMHHAGSNGPWPGDIPRYKITCTRPEPTTTELLLMAALGFFVTDGDKDALAPDGKSFSGNFQNQPAPSIKVHHRYSFRCSRSC